MEINPQLLDKIQNDNEEFKKLYAEHNSLKQKVVQLNKLKFLTGEQEVEKKKHQKEKLKAKDRLEQMLSEYESRTN
jgi:uncharacterized protein YdcH (DUF465 family)